MQGGRRRPRLRVVKRVRVVGRVAVVTGGAGGIGRAVARRLVEHGAKVVVTDLDADRVDQAVRDIGLHVQGQVLGIAGDCAADADLHDLVVRAEQWAGPIDLYVANAGVAVGRGLQAPEGDWTVSVDVNLMAHVRAARILVPKWVERGGGYFVSTASAAGLLTQIGSPAYAVTKHAAVAFAEWLAVTYGSMGVKVSCLCPMGVDTAMFRTGIDSEDRLERLATRAVAGSGAVLEPLQVADAVMAGIRHERFLILPHPEVAEMYRRKAADVDRWIAGMSRYQSSLR
jgi:NAD(P)-dependent dehydrogenase (short-subunit alcohol dehydrogenase family)